MHGADPPSRLSLAELLADLSLVTDLGVGNEPETAARTCLLATGLARGVGLTEDVVADVFYTALLLHLGCTASAHEAAALYGGDDIAVNASGARTDLTAPAQILTTWLPGVLKGLPLRTKLRAGATALVRGGRVGALLQTASCEVAAGTARRLGLSAGVQEAIGQAFESWNGKGRQRMAGEAIAVPIRVAQVAALAALFDRLGGPESAVAVIAHRSGRVLDPGLAAAFVRLGPNLLGEMGGVDVRAMVVASEPEPRRRVGEPELNGIAAAFGDLADLKSPSMLGHAAGVAALAEAAGRELHMNAEELTCLRRAGLLHDIGRVGVPSGIWDEAGPLTTSQWERVRLHPYYTERILARSAALADAGRIAGMHHERQDGSGYHRQTNGQGIPLAARVLAAADAFQAMTQPRPFRPALEPAKAAAALGTEVTEGRMDPDAVAAVLAACGQRRRARRSWPGGLTAREVEVLRLLAVGLSARQVAQQLVISPKTADHHIQHIYTKLGISTRAAAALYAMEHGLLPD